MIISISLQYKVSYSWSNINKTTVVQVYPFRDMSRTTRVGDWSVFTEATANVITLEAHLHVPSMSPFFVSGTFDLFDVVCEQHHRAALKPILNGTKNGDVDGTCKQTNP